MTNKFILIDNENDAITVNDTDSWETPEDCFEDLKYGIRRREIDREFLPWKLVHYQRGKRRNAMLVHTRIKDYTTDIVFDKI